MCEQSQPRSHPRPGDCAWLAVAGSACLAPRARRHWMRPNSGGTLSPSGARKPTASWTTLATRAWGWCETTCGAWMRSRTTLARGCSSGSPANAWPRSPDRSRPVSVRRASCRSASTCATKRPLPPPQIVPGCHCRRGRSKCCSVLRGGRASDGVDKGPLGLPRASSCGCAGAGW